MIRCLLLSLLLLLPATINAAELPTLLQFADSLAANNDHYRAITEYKRFLFMHPESPLVPQTKLAIATSLVAGKRWKQADSSLEDLIVSHPRSPEASKARLIYADTAFERGEFGLARERYRTLAKIHTDQETLDYTNFRIGWTFLEQDKPQKAETHFNLLSLQHKEQLLGDLEAYQALPQKSPRVAGSLSAILPGAGQVYTGRYRQAALSFLLNGAFILGSIEAFNDNNYATGSILLFFELGWYGGNIYNAVNNAHKFNQRTKHNYRQGMRSRLNLQVGILKHNPLITLNYKF